MSSQHFDKKIADRLKGLSVPPDPNAWHKISSRLPPTWLGLLIQKWGLVSYFVASSAAIVALWFQFNHHRQDYQKLQGSYQEMKSDFDRISAELQHVKKQNASSQDWLSPASPSNQKPLNNPGQNLLAKEQEFNPAKFAASSGSHGSNLKKPGLQSAPLLVDHQNALFPESVKSENQMQKMPELDQRRDYTENQQNGADKPLLAESRVEIRKEATGSSSSLVNIADSSQPSKKDSTTLLNVVKAPDSTLISQKPKDQGKKKLLELLRPRIGGEFISNFKEMYGFGASLEFPIGKNLGFALGILGYQQVSADFENESIFNAKTSKKFRDEYADNLKPYSGDLNEITLKTSLMEVPVRFKYYWPLSNRFSIIASMGTHLNMSIRQEIRFETHENNRENYHTFIHRPAPEIFHNIVFSPGIQYRKDNMFLQISPYYQFNYTQIEYLDKPHILGLSFSLWFKP